MGQVENEYTFVCRETKAIERAIEFNDNGGCRNGEGKRKYDIVYRGRLIVKQSESRSSTLSFPPIVHSSLPMECFSVSFSSSSSRRHGHQSSVKYILQWYIYIYIYMDLYV